MSMVYLALYKGKGKFGNGLVRWWTRSQYSHCEMVVDGVSYSSSIMDGGVRSKVITFDDQKWDLMTLPESMGQRVIEYFEATKGQSYSWIDLIRSQLFNRSHDEPEAAFCSDWCAAALGIPNSTAYSPRTLADLLRWSRGGFIGGTPTYQGVA